jgi:hypothetical protein
MFRIYYRTPTGPAVLDTDTQRLPPSLHGAVVLAVCAQPRVRVAGAADLVVQEEYRRVVPAIVDSGWEEVA